MTFGLAGDYLLVNRGALLGVFQASSLRTNFFWKPGLFLLGSKQKEGGGDQRSS